MTVDVHCSAGFKLRDYQSESLKVIRQKYLSGIHRQLVCLPTGSGKTVIFAEFPAYFRMKRRMLVLAHREELLEQARAKIERANPKLHVAIEQGGRKAAPDCDVVVASVPTLGRKSSRRLKRLDPDQFFLIVVDEAHHATAATYRRVLDYFGVFAENTRKLLVGFTATPKRGDGEGLDKIFEEIVFSRGLPEMVRAGFLAPVAAYRVETDVDLSRVKTRMGDFVTSHLSRAVNVTYRNDLVVDVFRSYLRDRQTLCFCVDVAHAHCLAESFREAGIPARAVSGNMSRAERREALSDFQEQRIRVLANCMVLTEGFDEPSVAGIILARPTRSALLYTQMIGRGTRLYPGKDKVTIVDIVDVTRDHKLTTLPSLFDLSDDFNMEGRTIEEVRGAIKWAETNRPWVPVEEATSLSDLRYRCKMVDLLDLETPYELLHVSNLAWVAMGRNAYRIGLPRGKAIVVQPDILNHFEVYLRDYWREDLVFRSHYFEETINWADSFILDKWPDAVKLVSRDTHWRYQPASEKQLNLLHSKKIAVPPDLTRGQASHIISMLPHPSFGGQRQK